MCTGYCSVAVVDRDTVLSAQHEAMTRGHVERLAPMVSDVLADAGLVPAYLDGIAVTTGPGSFTGARLGVSFARGLSLAAKAPAVGVSVFEAMQSDLDIETVVALPGKNGSILVQCFAPDGTPRCEPTEFVGTDTSDAVPETGAFSVVGSAAEAFLERLSEPMKARAVNATPSEVSGETVARIGMTKLMRGTLETPAPLYVRAADAKPQAAVNLGA